MSIMQKLGDQHRGIELSRKVLAFSEYARLLMLSGGSMLALRALAEKNSRITAYAPELKAAISAGTPSTWGASLVPDAIISAFLESLSTVGAFDAMLPSMRRVPFRSAVAVTTSAATAHGPGPAELKA